MNVTQALQNASSNGSQIAHSESLLFPLTVWMAIGLVVNGLGTLGNGILLTATLTYRPLRSASNWPLMAHNIALDLIMSLISNPGAIAVTFDAYRQPLTLTFCRLWAPIRFLTQSVCTWSHCALAVNRFLAIVSPKHYKRLVTRKAILAGIFFPWIIGGSVVLFPTTGLVSRFVPDSTWAVGCQLVSNNPGFETYRVLMNVYVPLIISGICYVLVMVNAKIALHVRVGQVTPLVDRNARNRYETSKVLLLCFVWYFSPNLAANIFYMKQSQRPPPFMVLIGKGLQCVISAVNPVRKSGCLHS
ncbi:hypothetical protein BV898_16870 [Hypsibius exemplaris]|uniref:G-protein coupled receptors family 1 profile domain-containing protein n=1 Tax=Hypsibius exemplaris TaxID=2072580 RepID=A0A9X6RLH2_HYPEX|nr:hypothetical protein BV898_16870 [Hypsibius exemplaris]